jgi:cytochrome o ubiquinol oxidase subunit II
MINWQGGLFDPQGPIAVAERTMLANATVVMLAVVIPVIILTFGFAWWFRAGNPRAKRRPDWEYSGAIEVTVWSIPILVIIFLGGMTWVGSHDLDPKKPIGKIEDTLDVQVVSLDWKWLFIYPKYGIATINHLELPANTPIRLTLTSSGVMNSFLVPQLGSQIYTMAGMATTLHLQADNEGVFPGISAQFSGDGFSDMRFNVNSVSNSAFTAWVEKTQAGNATLDKAAYDALLSPSISTGEQSYGKVAQGLFDEALMMNDSGPNKICRSPQPSIIAQSTAIPDVTQTGNK